MSAMSETRCLPDPAEAVRRFQQALLSLLPATYPAQWSTDELVQALVADQREFGERDTIERAIRE